MLKKLGIPTLVLAGILALLTPPRADGRVRLHVGVGVGAPVYTYPYPAYPAYPYGYTYPGYVTPYTDPFVYDTWSFGHHTWGGHERHHERFEHRDHDRHWDHDRR
jgi:hypothetical protein